MKINSVELTISAVRQSQYPEDKKPEFLLVGRSNVGKSSFINSIIERRDAARVSSKPGKTQTLNFYNINGDFYLVDVPGYGYASVSKEVQAKLFKQMFTTKGKNGTGLGLFMSYSTIRGNFNGDITFDSEEGKGTTFHIILPM